MAKSFTKEQTEEMISTYKKTIIRAFDDIGYGIGVNAGEIAGVSDLELNSVDEKTFFEIALEQLRMNGFLNAVGCGGNRRFLKTEKFAPSPKEKDKEAKDSATMPDLSKFVGSSFDKKEPWEGAIDKLKAKIESDDGVITKEKSVLWCSVLGSLSGILDEEISDVLDDIGEFVASRARQ